jgi:hypothetical protein
VGEQAATGARDRELVQARAVEVHDPPRSTSKLLTDDATSGPSEAPPFTTRSSRE